MSFSTYARDPLAWLAAHYGPRLPLLARKPGLLAAVDQHAAALRDAVPLTRQHLTDYLLGFLDELHANGWHPHHPEPFPALRLLAVCHLADRLGMLETSDPGT
ncbi:MAG TPA: DUF6401 family natural product biosynthesis protein [Streptomyces sp.]|uniref:DUF6401 family natural product biosynthesis protein n=1 Tax=Streptomyces sp. TaxID=1931 RepID=UPI002D5C25EA|nr:DUF6401 family natural product biosynthesis protein [Streptomyces sp.]HZG05933.1 DUF6401 family natural product biosynthesis protein [Streptomyces sp.]